MLPGYVGLQDDYETLEVVDGGTWSELSIAHRDLVPPVATPSGQKHRFEMPSSRFPAAVELTGLGALSDALVCRRRWSSPAVIKERDMLLCSGKEAFWHTVNAWRERAVPAAKAAFELVWETEKAAFGDKSYFYHLERVKSLGIAFPALAPDEDEVEG